MMDRRAQSWTFSLSRYKRVIPTEQKHNGTLTVAAWARKVILLFVLGPKGLKI